MQSMGGIKKRLVSPLQRFKENVRKDGEHWIWIGTFHSRGTPLFWWHDKGQHPVRFAVAFQHGTKLESYHRCMNQCGVRACVNPDHFIFRDSRRECRNGHSLDGPRPFVYSKGGKRRDCRQCHNARIQRKYAKDREKHKH
jgi:hypothetical protein